MQKNKKIKLRATFNLVLEDNTRVKDGEIFEIDREQGKKLRMKGVAQLPSAYVNKGMRISRKVYETLLKMEDDIKKMIKNSPKE